MVLPKKEKVFAPELLEVIEQTEFGNLQAVYETLVTKYGQKLGLKQYKHIKRLITKIQTALREKTN